MSAEKKAYICERLLDMMEGQSFFSIKVTSFIKYAGVGRSTFYFYFDSLYDVLQTIEDEYFDGLLPEAEIAQASRSGRKTRVDSGFIGKVSYIERNKRALRILIGENGDPSFAVKLVNRNKRITREVLRGRHGLSEAQIDLQAEYIAAGQVQALKWWLAHEDKMELCDLMLALERNMLALCQ